MLSKIIKSLQVYHAPLLLCLVGNTQHDYIYKDRLKTRFIIAWNCSYILIILMYFSFRAFYDTVAKPAVKRAALCFHREEATTQLQK